MQQINWKSFLFWGRKKISEDDARSLPSDRCRVCVRVCLSGALTPLESPRVSVRSNLENPHKLCSRLSDDAVNDCFRSLFHNNNERRKASSGTWSGIIVRWASSSRSARPLSFAFAARLGKAIKSVSNTHAIRLHFCASRGSNETPRNRLIIELLISCEKRGWRVCAWVCSRWKGRPHHKIIIKIIWQMENDERFLSGTHLVGNSWVYC